MKTDLIETALECLQEGLFSPNYKKIRKKAEKLAKDRRSPEDFDAVMRHVDWMISNAKKDKAKQKDLADRITTAILNWKFSA